MLLSIQHATTYAFSDAVSYGLQQLRLIPKSRRGQSVLTWNTMVDGATKELEFDDQHMNRVWLVSFTGGITQISVVSQGEVETMDTAGVVGHHAGFAPLWLFTRPTHLTRAGNGVRGLAKGLSERGTADLGVLHELSARVLGTLPYITGKTSSITSAEEALAGDGGVCQDHAQIFCSAARVLGFPARYVSGYLLVDAEGTQEAGHAWAEAHVDGLGWVGFDISNQICPDERYVRVATGLDYAEAAPIHGLRLGEGVSETLSVDIQVQQ
jgi:transglutaminase-like putative cysteine protease